MFCIICRKHDTINPQNKSKKFNTEPSVRFKRKTVEEPASHQQHLAAVEAELPSWPRVFRLKQNDKCSVASILFPSIKVKGPCYVIITFKNSPEKKNF